VPVNLLSPKLFKTIKVFNLSGILTSTIRQIPYSERPHSFFQRGYCSLLAGLQLSLLLFHPALLFNRHLKEEVVLFSWNSRAGSVIISEKE
jgi:hypothetical protein